MIRLLQGDCRETLKTLAAGSVQCCVTSPPYFGLRDYQTPPLVWGGDAECSHKFIGYSAEAHALSLQTWNTGTVDQSGQRSTRRDRQVDACGTPLLLEADGQPARLEELQEPVRKSRASSRKRSPTGTINTAVSVEDSTNKIPDEQFGDLWEYSSQALAGFDSKAAQLGDEPSTPNRPAVSDVAGTGALFANGGRGSDKVTNELNTATVETDEVDRPRLHDTPIGDHQSNYIGQVGRPVNQAVKTDGIRADASTSSPVSTAQTRVERDGRHLLVPSGAVHLDTATDAFDDASSEPIGTRKSTPVHSTMVCQNCGAIKCSLGLEPTPELYIEHLVDVFREVRRVLRDDATCWINLGDSYAGSGKGPSGHNGIGNQVARQGFTGISPKSTLRNDGRAHTGPYDGEKMSQPVLGGGMAAAGYKAKDLLMMPFRVAMALQQDGWYLRSVIPWLKRNSMPESVRDRPANSVEYIFLLAKSARYFFDADAVRVTVQSERGPNMPNMSSRPTDDGVLRRSEGARRVSAALQDVYGEEASDTGGEGAAQGVQPIRAWQGSATTPLYEQVGLLPPEATGLQPDSGSARGEPEVLEQSGRQGDSVRMEREVSCSSDRNIDTNTHAVAHPAGSIQAQVRVLPENGITHEGPSGSTEPWRNARDEEHRSIMSAVQLSEVESRIPAVDGTERDGLATSGRNLRNSDFFRATAADLIPSESWQGLMLDEHDDPLALVVNPTGFNQAHFATFPPKLVEPMVKASTSEKGQCPECRAPWVRVVHREVAPADVFTNRAAPTDGYVHSDSGVDGGMRGHGQKLQAWRDENPSQTTGWRPSCAHTDAAPVPQVVLDCFSGAGTVGLVADRLGRDAILCELKESYADMGADRIIGDNPMFTELDAL